MNIRKYEGKNYIYMSGQVLLFISFSLLEPIIIFQ